MRAVLKHELSGYFHSMTAYIFAAFLLAFVGVGAMMYNIRSSVANFEYVLSFVCIGFVAFVPIITMRVISEERKQRTDQLLYSLPLKTTQIVLGKYLAMLVVYLIPLAIIAVYPLVFAQYGEVYLPTSYGSLLAFFCMGAALISIGMFISSLTDSQGMAAGITVAVILINYFSVSLADYVSTKAIGSAISFLVIAVLLGALIRSLTRNENLALGFTVIMVVVVGIIYFIDSSRFEGLLPNIMEKLSLFERFYTFTSGVFDLTAIVYYLTVIVFFSFLTVQSLEKRRYN